MAWWIYIDGAAYGVHVKDDQAAKDASGYSWIPGIITTIVFIMCVVVGRGVERPDDSLPRLMPLHRRDSPSTSFILQDQCNAVA